MKKEEPRQKGSALLLAMAATILLFIIGFGFLLQTQHAKRIVGNLDERASLDRGIAAVIEQINKVLVEDVMAYLVGGDPNSYYDYPGDNDPWLATLEPEIDDNGFFSWRHITDLYGNRFERPTSWVTIGKPDYYSLADRDQPGQWNSGNSASDLYYVSWNTNDLLCRIVGERESTETIVDGADVDFPAAPEDIWLWGAQADADGDGVADSRWVRIPDLTGPAGQNVYTAVRIIDNCGMVNINTAYRDPTGVGSNWDGSLLTHINLEHLGSGPRQYWGIRAESELDSLDVLHKARISDLSLPTDSDYHDEFARRTGNPVKSNGSPVVYYTPFDISDELELRNRYFLDSEVIGRLGNDDFSGVTMWSVTFTPDRQADGTVGGSVGKELPYIPGGNLDAWFDKATSTETANSNGWTPATPAIFNYNRRHITTTYSFDRVIIPRPKTWPNVDGDTIPDELESAWKEWTNWDVDPIPPAVTHPSWSYRCVDINDVVGGSEPIELLAAALWIGLPKNSVLNAKSEIFDLEWVSSDTPEVNPRDRIACQWAVNIVDHIDDDSDITKITVDGDDYFGFESLEHQVYITRLGISQYDSTDPPGDGDEVTHYAIVLYNHSTLDVTMNNWKVDVDGAQYDIPDGTVVPGGKNMCVLLDENTSEGFQLSDIISPPDSVAVFVTAMFKFTDGDEITLLDNQDRPVDVVTVDDIGDEVDDPAEIADNVVAVDTRYIFWTDDREDKRSIGLRVPDDEELLVWDSLSDLGSWGDPESGNIGVLLPSSTSLSTVSAKIQIKSLNAATSSITNVGGISHIPVIGSMTIGNTYLPAWKHWEKLIDAPTVGDIDTADIDWGHLDASDKDYRKIYKYLTVSNFAPFNDGVDNDGNGDTDEESELAIAGRININTAPWFVIAQLPWIQDPALLNNDSDKFKLAHAIVAYRDKLDLSAVGGFDPGNGPDYFTPGPGWLGPDSAKTRKFGMGLNKTDDDVREELGFASIAELINVTHAGATDYYDIRRFGRDGAVPPVTPDYTPDSAVDDLEERDVIFHRVSNLVTVRSDVFTAYILVRVGERGAQRRMIAIFDRSNVYTAKDRPKLVALHPVADPR